MTDDKSENTEFDILVRKIRELEKTTSIKVRRVSTLYELEKMPVHDLSPLERRALLLWKNGAL